MTSRPRAARRASAAATGASAQAHADPGHPLEPRAHAHHAALVKRLNRIEGQVRGLSRMVEEDRYCIDIITQIAAVRAALGKVEDELLRDHVGHCVEHAIASGNKADQRQKIAELIDVLARSGR